MATYLIVRPIFGVLLGSGEDEDDDDEDDDKDEDSEGLLPFFFAEKLQQVALCGSVIEPTLGSIL